MNARVYQEAARMAGICNACRYCEGYCAVFPAIERRIDFARDDLDYLANLCHNCGACYAACQYAPPHEFAVNIPRALAQVRLDRTKRTRGRAFGVLFRRQPALISLLLASCLTLFFALGIAWRGDGFFRAYTATGSFYAIFPHNFLIAMFGVSFGFACFAITVGALRFWRAIELRDSPAPHGAAASAMLDAATLKYLDGGGEGCSETNYAPARTRRVLHHLTFYGFVLCLASTIVASLYHYALDWPAPISVAQFAGAARRRRRHRIDNRTRGVVVAAIDAARGATRPIADVSGCGIYVAAPDHRSHWADAARLARNGVDANAARPASGTGARLVPAAAVRQIRARYLPCARARQISPRARTSQSLRIGIDMQADTESSPATPNTLSVSAILHTARAAL